jgi:hypothetical protein
MKQNESNLWTKQHKKQGRHTTPGTSVKIAVVIQNKPWTYNMCHICVPVPVPVRWWNTPEIIIPNKQQSTMNLAVMTHLNSAVSNRIQVCKRVDHRLRLWEIRSINTTDMAYADIWKKRTLVIARESTYQRLDNESDNLWKPTNERCSEIHRPNKPGNHYDPTVSTP